MPITSNEGSFQYARRLIAGGRFVADEPDLWNEHRPSAGRENAFIEEHGMDEYERWHLGIDDELPKDTKTR